MGIGGAGPPRGWNAPGKTSCTSVLTGNVFAILSKYLCLASPSVKMPTKKSTKKISPCIFEILRTKPLDMLYFDIETDTSGAFPKPKRNIIIAISYALNNNDLVTYTINDIKQGDSNILERFFGDVEKLNPDVLIGYNCLGFDLPYIIDRARINGISDSALTRNRGDASFVN